MPENAISHCWEGGPRVGRGCQLRGSWEEVIVGEHLVEQTAAIQPQTEVWAVYKPGRTLCAIEFKGRADVPAEVYSLSIMATYWNRLGRFKKIPRSHS